MTTKEIIQKLKEVDPSGNLHVRPSGGGAILGFHKVEGYYDGSYEYIDEDGKLLNTTKGYKIDVFTVTKNDIIWDNDGDMNEIKKQIKFDINIPYSVKQEDDFWNKIEEEAKKAQKTSKQSLEEFTFKVLQKYKDGLIMIESISEDKKSFGYYWLQLNGEKNVPQCGEFHAVVNSGFFTRDHYSDEYYQWKLNI